MAKQTRTRGQSINEGSTDSDAVLADIAVVTKLLRIVDDQQLLSATDCERLHRLASEVTVGQMREWLAPRRLKVTSVGVRPC